MATRRQVQAAKSNIRKAQRAATKKRTIAKLPEATRRDLGRHAAKGRARGGTAGRALEDRNRQQLYDRARELGSPGRSKIGTWDLIAAIRRAG